MADPLANGPEDEKEIARSEKEEALKEQEKAHVKKAPKHGGGGGGKFRKSRQD